MSDKAIQYVKDYPSAKVKLAITDIDGILRGKVIHKDKFLSILEKGFGFCDVVFGWDSSDDLYENVDFTGWHTGFPDANAMIDLSTFRKVPWDNDIPFFLADFTDNNGNPLPICPRNLLKRIKQETLDTGFTPFFSVEFEWFNFKETPNSLYGKNFRNIRPITPGMFGYSILRSSFPIMQIPDKSKTKDNQPEADPCLPAGEAPQAEKNKKSQPNKTFFNNIFDWLKLYNVPLEGLHTETGQGVYEAAILYSDILEAADRAVLFKTGVKEIAYRHEVIACFMAKWNEKLPGCSGHVHQSLWQGKKNLFYDKKDKNGMSKLMQSYVAGQLYCLPYILPMYAPSINSYKRLVEGAWAPTTLTWGMDNRTTALRTLTGGEKSARLETRVPGSDINPYLAMAACLASGLYGIKKRMKLKQPQTTGNGYEEFKYGVLPKNLKEATQAMKKSELAKELFGEGFVNHFVQTREWEWRQYQKAVKNKSNKTISNWELKRYFEII
ncbi:glutamine synthetase [bacterium AH-315-M05]|nr:glutamine synthetase [bacterium AH-315-M05]